MAKPTWVYLVAAARKVWRWSPERREVKKSKGCKKCGIKFDEKNKPEIDHIEPIGKAPREFNGWDDYYKRLFVPAKKMQALCHKCHVEKSRLERKNAKKQSKSA